MTIKGTILDSLTNQPIKGVKIDHNTITSFSNSDGKFSIEIEGDSNLIFNYNGYKTFEKYPFKKDETIKDNLLIQLVPIQYSSITDKIKYSQLSEVQINSILSNKKDFKFYAQKKLNDNIGDIKNKLIPTIINLISSFGITDPQQFINNPTLLINKQQCPNKIEIDILINRKNKLVKQLNNTYKTIDITTKILGVNGGIIEAFNIIFQVLKNLPIPSAVAGVGLPISVINGIQDIKTRLDEIITGLRNINEGALITLLLLRQVLLQSIEYLNLLDKLIQNCYPNVEQESISQELLSLTTQQSTQQSPTVINVNGFEMGVETEITEKPLKRRRAIARNKQGVIMLKGEWSFSSIDQILIDELVFYIQINNLKAE
jgi:hypothetical protein